MSIIDNRKLDFMYNHEPSDYSCPFCSFVDGEETDLNKRTDIVYETDDAIAHVSPKWWPNNPGNVIIIPKLHVENVYDISRDLLCKIYSLSKDVAIGMKKIYGCDGISFRQHNEPAGNQAIWHFHLHVMPRWKGDDLYINHNKSKYVSADERKFYANKLRDYFNS